MDRWESIHNRHQGETCLVVGNGPSLARVPQAYLSRYPSFGANRCYLYNQLALGPIEWHPTYYVSVNPLVLSQYLEEVKQEVDAAGYFVAQGYLAQLGDREGYGLRSIYQPVFSRKPWRGIYEGHTVTYVSLQLAHFMGFTTVLLVGVDHRYQAPDGTAPNQELPGFEEGDPNHFHPSYFGPGSHWHMADLERSAAAYKLARQAFEADGRSIINLGPDSALDVFESKNMDAVLL